MRLGGSIALQARDRMIEAKTTMLSAPSRREVSVGMSSSEVSSVKAAPLEGHVREAGGSTSTLVYICDFDQTQTLAMQVGVKCVRLEGSMALQARDRMIEAFTNDPSVTVFLMSLKAGGVALNLTAASHVMLMDPWWNPSVEFQVS